MMKIAHKIMATINHIIIRFPAVGGPSVTVAQSETTPKIISIGNGYNIIIEQRGDCTELVKLNCNT